MPLTLSRRTTTSWLLASLLALPLMPAVAARAAVAAEPDNLAEPARGVLLAFLATQTAGLPGVVSVQASTPATGALPVCIEGALEAFLPAGTRAWGRVLVGLRCKGSTAQSTWTRYVSTHIAVQGDYYVASKAISAGQLLASSDAELRQGDLTALPASVVTDLPQWHGAQALNAVAPGAPLRRELLRGLPLVQQGQTVKVLMRGTGFVVTTEGKALTAAAAGARLQVKLSSGQQITGVLGTDGQVERVQ